MCKSEYKLTRKMQWDGDVLTVQDEIHDVLREAKQAMTDAMTGEVLNHFECDFSDFREYMHDKIKWEQKQWAAMPKWIPVTERLPEDDTIVLVVSQLYHDPYPAFQIGGVWYDGYLVACQAENDMDDDWTIDDSGITHWMPLPEPPKEEDDG